MYTPSVATPSVATLSVATIQLCTHNHECDSTIDTSILIKLPPHELVDAYCRERESRSLGEDNASCSLSSLAEHEKEEEPHESAPLQAV
jgi:hypothetical protein